MICLDTNAVIAVLKQEPERLLARFARALPRGDVALSAIVLFELQYGVADGVRRKENTERLTLFLQAPIEVLPFDAEDAEEAGILRAELRRAGTPIGAYDLLIAAQARRRGALLITANAGEFTRVAGLKTEDWTAA
ncbi:MAG: VapC toxin family PIN domain ribonuclease [Bradyrhizobiaceae bacterium]|nr:MAG: VapC toxin family PIN domain ribonuclease [Bradyrhizobiaceae bacterium]